MPGGSGDPLIDSAVQYVSANDPCKPNDLVRWLRKSQGASHQAANVTLMKLIRDGHVKRTMSGKLTSR